jgi:hypothetical protein
LSGLLRLRCKPWLCGVLALFCVSVSTASNSKPAALAAAVTQAASSEDIPLVGRNAAGVSVPSAPNAWGGARSGREATLSDRVVKYQMSASLDPVKHSVDGHELLTWRNRSDRTVQSVYLHLYLNAFESRQSTFFSEESLLNAGFRTDVDTKDGEWGHIQLTKTEQNGVPIKVTFVHPDGGPSTDHTVVRFDLPQSVAPGASTTLDITFKDQLPRVVARTGYFGTFHLIGQWFPKIAVLELPGERGATTPRWNAHEFHLNSEFYADYGTYDVHLTVPQGFTVGAVGEEVDPPVATGGTVTHHFVQSDVHDFAWSADSRTAPILVGQWTGPGSPPVTIKVLYPPEMQATAPQVLKTTQDALSYFSKTVAPYPYRSVTVIVPPYNAGEAGGMEYPTFFTSEGDTEAPDGTFQRDSLDFTNIHEFGHGYFYGILGSNEFEEPMLDEGLNEFWDMRMLRERHQLGHLTTPFLKRLGFEIDTTGFQWERLDAMLSSPQDGSAASSWNRLSNWSYISLYGRTAVGLHDLEALIGKDAMEKSFQAYYQRWKFRHPSIADFRQSLMENSGQPELVSRYFDQQVYHVARVDDSVESLTCEEQLPVTGTHEIAGQWSEDTSQAVAQSIEQSRAAWAKANPHPAPGTGPFLFKTTVVLRRHGAPVPETLLVKFADGSSETASWDDDQQWARFSWIKPVRVVSAQIDPEHVRLLDADKFNDGRNMTASHQTSLRLTGDVAAWFQTILALMVTQ